MATHEPHVVVLGAGFGGLAVCQNLTAKARITLVDRTNHHLFQPLLYQVAMAGLAAPDVAEPIRSIFAGNDHVTVLMDEVKNIDLAEKRVEMLRHSVHYDYLVIGLGGVTSYFGKAHWERYAPGLKTLDDAMRIRRRVLSAFEAAEVTEDPDERERLMTVVVVGGGPTGVELAGAMAELATRVFRRDFRRIDPTTARVVLVEGGTRILPSLPERLSHSAREQLESLGVEVRLGVLARDVRDGCVELSDGTVIQTRNVLWGAGIRAAPVTATLGIELGPGGRIPVEADLSLASHPEVFAVGDIAHCVDDTGAPVPGVAPAAMQMGAYVAQVIGDDIRGMTGRKPFRYRDKGTMATIGRSRAVAWAGLIQLTGFVAWLAWLFIHLLFLVGFRSKLSVLLQWSYAYLSFKRGARILFDLHDEILPPDLPPAAHLPDDLQLPATTGE